MKTLYKSFFTLLICMTTATADQMPTTSLPKDLLYQNQPIDPRCFENKDTAALNECTHDANSNEKISGHNSFLINKGYIGADYISTDKDKYPAGYSYYKVIGNYNGKYIIYSISSGGGSGEFTAVKLVKRMNDQLQIQTIKAGDRCKGVSFKPCK